MNYLDVEQPMALRDTNETRGHQFCGNCGTATVHGATACGHCGNPIEHEDHSQKLSGDYIPYCRACGVPVAKDESLNCTKCGVTPLCREHYFPSTRSCALCPPLELPDTGELPETGERGPGTLPNRPNGPWPKPAVSMPCLQCGARILQGVQFCPNCGRDQEDADDSKYAGFFVRLGAFIIDNLILLVAGTALFALVEIPALGLLITIPYYVAFTYKLGQTPGKRLLGLQVVDSDGSIPDFRRVILREVIAKSVPSMLLIAGAFSIVFLVAGYIAGTSLLLGYLWVARDPKKQGLHDHIGGTFVVKRKRD